MIDFETLLIALEQEYRRLIYRLSPDKEKRALMVTEATTLFRELKKHVFTKDNCIYRDPTDEESNSLSFTDCGCDCKPFKMLVYRGRTLAIYKDTHNDGNAFCVSQFIKVEREFIDDDDIMLRFSDIIDDEILSSVIGLISGQ